MSNPFFSLIMPAYNAVSTIRESMDHALGQTFTDFELLLVDDGSTDDTLKYARYYESRDRRVRVFSKLNGGVASVYRFAIPRSSGEFVVITPSDDLIYPSHLAATAAAIREHPEFDIFCCNGERLLDTGERARTYIDAKHSQPHEVTLLDVIEASFFSVGVAYRRALYDRLGGYRADVYGEDWDFWLRAMKQEGARVWYTPQVLAGNRVRAENKSADLAKVYSSDIAILSSFADSYDLTPEERHAVQDAIARREALGRRLTGVSRYAAFRGRVRDALMRRFGVERVERAVAKLKFWE